MFLIQTNRQKKNIVGNENNAMYSKLRKCQFQWRHKNCACALNIELTQSVAILTFEWKL